MAAGGRTTVADGGKGAGQGVGAGASDGRRRRSGRAVSARWRYSCHLCAGKCKDSPARRLNECCAGAAHVGGREGERLA